MRKHEAETLYTWFKLYQGEIPDWGKWDFLKFIKPFVKLTESHELFYYRYGKEHNLLGEKRK